jgi:hypothetical protein
MEDDQSTCSPIYEISVDEGSYLVNCTVSPSNILNQCNVIIYET